MDRYEQKPHPLTEWLGWAIGLLVLIFVVAPIIYNFIKQPLGLDWQLGDLINNIKL